MISIKSAFKHSLMVLRGIRGVCSTALKMQLSGASYEMLKLMKSTFSCKQNVRFIWSQN